MSKRLNSSKQRQEKAKQHSPYCLLSSALLLDIYALEARKLRIETEMMHPSMPKRLKILPSKR